MNKPIMLVWLGGATLLVLAYLPMFIRDGARSGATGQMGLLTPNYLSADLPCKRRPSAQELKIRACVGVEGAAGCWSRYTSMQLSQKRWTKFGPSRARLEKCYENLLPDIRDVDRTLTIR
jgi:hypothetical protein